MTNNDAHRPLMTSLNIKRKSATAPKTLIPPAAVGCCCRCCCRCGDRSNSAPPPLPPPHFSRLWLCRRTPARRYTRRQQPGARSLYILWLWACGSSCGRGRGRDRERPTAAVITSSCRGLGKGCEGVI